MSFDGITLNAVKQELEKLLVGSRVDKVYQPEKQTIILKFRIRSGSPYLLLSSRADAARVHLVDTKPESPKQPPVFCMVLRKHLEGARLTAITQQGLERILTFSFESINEAGSPERLSLHCEVMGKHSNIVLVNQLTGCILDGAKRFTHEVNRYREILPGIPYELPPNQDKRDVRALTEEEFHTLVLSHPLDLHLDKVLLQILEGFSPLLCREIVFRAGLSKEMVLNQCGEYELERLWQELSSIAGRIESGAFNATLVLEGKTYLEYSPFDLALFQANKKEHYQSINAALRNFFQAKEAAERLNGLKHRLNRVVHTHIKKVGKKLEAQKQDLKETERAEDDRIAGELITANMYAISRGDKQLQALNYYDPEQKSLLIELDPSLSPSQNAQRYFKKYRKAAVKRQKAAGYIAQFQEELTYLDTVSMAISQAEAMGELEEIEEELTQEGYIRGEKRKAHTPKPTGYLSFKSSEGFKIMVGKNNRQNDYLTMKTAKDDDVWLHAKDMPGAHVIIKTEGTPPPERTLTEAAMLAAYYSKGKMSGNVPVDYTLREHVRKPRGAKPGLVIYDHQSTLFVTPDEALVRSLQEY